MKWTDAHRRHAIERIAELLREIGLLWFVFATLDKLVAEQLTVSWLGWNALIAATVWVAGLVLELRRIES